MGKGFDEILENMDADASVADDELGIIPQVQIVAEYPSLTMEPSGAGAESEAQISAPYNDNMEEVELAIKEMREDGFVLDDIITDGQWHRCGTASHPNSSDGSYKASYEDGALKVRGTLFDEGGKTRIYPKRNARRARKNKGGTTQSDHAAQEMAAEKERQDLAALSAQKIWQDAEPACADDPYLKLKGIAPTEDIRRDKYGNTVFIMRDKDKRIVNAQTVYVDKNKNSSTKMFMSDGQTKGDFFQIGLPDNANYKGEIFIVEGGATACSVNKASGLPVVAAMSAGNLEAVAIIIKEMYPECEMLIYADNDEAPGKNNTGVDSAMNAGNRVGAYVAIPELIDGKPTDANDQACHPDYGDKAILETILKAKTNGSGAKVPRNFRISPDGIYYLKESQKFCVWEKIGDPINVKGMRSEKDGKNHEILIEWKDGEGRLHQQAIKRELLLSKENPNLKSMLSMGYTLTSHSWPLYQELFLHMEPIKKLLSVPRYGWQDDDWYFLNGVFGENPGKDVAYSGPPLKHPYEKKGSLEEWKKVPILAQGNPIISLGLCISFAGALLKLAGMATFGVQIYGPSSCGKTITCIIANSASKCPRDINSWHITVNALEVLAQENNDNLMVMDEMGEVAAKMLGTMIYMLNDGQGKGRRKPDANEMQELAKWRTIIFSSAELKAATIIKDANQKATAGQDVRMIPIPVEKLDLKNLHGYQSPEAFLQAITQICAGNYGTAGPEFLKQLTQREMLQRVKAEIQDRINQYVEQLCTPDADGQVRRVAKNFALIRYAGELAVEFGLFPAEFDPFSSTKFCFDRWVQDRGGVQCLEKINSIDKITGLIAEFESRFPELRYEARKFIPRETNPNSATPPVKWGFKCDEYIQGKVAYFINKETFRDEFCAGMNPMTVCQFLKSEGMIYHPDDRYARRYCLPVGGSKMFYYVLTLETGDTGVIDADDPAAQETDRQMAEQNAALLKEVEASRPFSM